MQIVDVIPTPKCNKINELNNKRQIFLCLWIPQKYKNMLTQTLEHNFESQFRVTIPPTCMLLQCRRKPTQTQSKDKTLNRQ